MISPSGRKDPASGVNGTEAFEDTVAAGVRDEVPDAAGVTAVVTGADKDEVTSGTGEAVGGVPAAVGAAVTERGV
jgi:hypothetical protein